MNNGLGAQGVYLSEAQISIDSRQWQNPVQNSESVNNPVLSACQSAKRTRVNEPVNRSVRKLKNAPFALSVNHSHLGGVLISW